MKFHLFRLESSGDKSHSFRFIAINFSITASTVDIPTCWNPRAKQQPTGLIACGAMRRRPVRAPSIVLTKRKTRTQTCSGFSWCRNAIQIRTISLGCNFCRFSKGDGLCSFFIVEGYQNLIIIQVNRIDKRIHQRLPLVFLAHIELAKTEKPETDEIFRHFRLCQLFFRNAGLKRTLGFFQLLQPLLGRAGQDSGLNRIEHILDTGFCIPELLFIKGNVGILLVLQFHHLGDDGFHGGIVPHKLHSLVDHQIFQPLFADGFLFAPFFFLAVAHL